MKKVLRASEHMAVQTRKQSKRSQMQQKAVTRINTSRFFPHNYWINILTSLNVGPVLLKSAWHTLIPKVNCVHNSFAVWDQFCKQFGPSLSFFASGIWPSFGCSCQQHPLCLVMETILRRAALQPRGVLCLPTNKVVRLERYTSNFLCHFDA